MEKLFNNNWEVKIDESEIEQYTASIQKISSEMRTAFTEVEDKAGFINKILDFDTSKGKEKISELGDAVIAMCDNAEIELDTMVTKQEAATLQMIAGAKVSTGDMLDSIEVIGT
jgi:phage host-nuclease inhibitor protein Gam